MHKTRTRRQEGFKAHIAIEQRSRSGQVPHRVLTPEKVDQAANRKKRGSASGQPVVFDAIQYKDRNTVERCINKIKAWRGLAARHDKTPDNYLAGLQLRGSIIWIRSLRPAT